MTQEVEGTQEKNPWLGSTENLGDDTWTEHDYDPDESPVERELREARANLRTAEGKARSEQAARNTPAADPHAVAYLGSMTGNPESLVAFISEEHATDWVAEAAHRQVWPVQSIRLGEPLRGVIIPARKELVDQEEWQRLRDEDQVMPFESRGER